MRQLTLIDMRPVCKNCDCPCDLLGQWSPSDNVWLCKDCTTKYPAPDVFVQCDNSRGVGLRQGMEANQLREDYHAKINVLVDIQRGCLHSAEDAAERNWYLPCHPLMGSAAYANCKLCRRRARMAHSGGRYGKAVVTAKTAEMPICRRCGCVHSYRYSHVSGYRAYCEHCDALNSVEALWRNRGIFGGDDAETVLDRIYSAFPELFENGVLPDYWYTLKEANNE